MTSSTSSSGARAQIVSIYTTKPGGLYRAMEVAAVCRAAV